MKCARLQLQERTKPVSKHEKNVSIEKPKRFCQKRMINPEHEEDPRWIDVLDRFRCHKENILNDTFDNAHERKMDDLYLTVQTLKFDGPVEQRKKPMTNFKYKTMKDSKKHRMFVKQVVQDEYDDTDRFSDLTNYYFDDYVKYLINNDRSRPTSSKSTLFVHEISKNMKENKDTQANIVSDKSKLTTKSESKNKTTDYNNSQRYTEDENIMPDDNIKGAKIMFNRFGKRKSLTISRAQSPETVQIIRVDVVCNSNSKIHEYEDVTENDINVSQKDNNLEIISIKNSRLATKYLLTSTIKTLDENLSGGAKVTLFCRTFKLSERSKNLEKNNTNSELMKIQKKTNCKVKKITKNRIN